MGRIGRTYYMELSTPSRDDHWAYRGWSFVVPARKPPQLLALGT